MLTINHADLLNLVVDAFGVILLIFFSAIGWFAVRLIRQIDAAPNKLLEKINGFEEKIITRMDSLMLTMQTIERDLRGDLSKIDRRVTHIEARSDIPIKED